jgi:hypothetical protein
MAGLHHKPAAQSVDNTGGAVVPASSAPGSTSSTMPVAKPQAAIPKAKPKAQKPSPATAEQASDAKTPRPDQKPVARAVNDSCDMNEADIQRSLSRAENYMHAGRLSDAQAAFQSVLGCASSREKAQDGLQRVKQRMQAQDLSPDL